MTDSSIRILKLSHHWFVYACAFPTEGLFMHLSTTSFYPLQFQMFTYVPYLTFCVCAPRNEAKGQILLEQILLSRASHLILLLLHGLCSAQSACTSGSNKTDLATSRCIPPDCWGFANMLMVTTTEGMLNGLCGEKKRTSVWGTTRDL